MSLSLFLSLMIVAAPVSGEIHPIRAAGVEDSEANAQSVAISPNGKYVAAGFGGRNPRASTSAILTPGRVLVWEAATGEVLVDHEEFGDIIKLGFTADSEALVYARIYTPGDSVRANTVRALEVPSGKTIVSWDADTFAISITDSLLAVGGRPM